MGKDWFSVERLATLAKLPPGSAVHVIGVAGVAMAQMAVALAERGFIVSGSDKEFYEPMASFLRGSTVKLMHGYDAKNVPQICDLVVIGNAVSYGHPEVAVVEERGLAYTIFPKLLFDLAIAGKHSVVVSGTHGKTTTTGMLACALRTLRVDPSFFVGGAVPGFSSGLNLGTGNISAVEGDEYDSSFFAKVPKFSFYRPDSLIINAIEFDHADIYPNLAAIDAEFEKLVLQMNSGTIYMCTDGAHERELFERWKKLLNAHANSANIVSFGTSDADVLVSSVAAGPKFQQVTITRVKEQAQKIIFKIGAPGLHNAKNSAACALVLRARGFSNLQIAEALESFAGVKRRQEVRFSSGTVTVIDDFAHHPTAVRETLAAIRQRFPTHKVIAVFEPRSATSRRKIFQAEYVKAFSTADEVLLCLPQARGGGDVELLDVAELANNIRSEVGVEACAKPDANTILTALTAASKSPAEAEQPRVILVMSNGGFGGLVQGLVDFFNGKANRI